MKNLKLIVILALVVLLLATAGCLPNRPVIKVGELVTRSESVELDEAKLETIEIGMGAGELNVNGGASDLMQGKFVYNIAQLNPQVTHRDGTLSVFTPDIERTRISLWNVEDYRYEWDLHLNENVPMKMHVVMGAGSADLNLGSLSLTKLDLDAGAGPVIVDLTGDWQNDLDATITGGLGEITLRLPRNSCAKVDIQPALGLINAQELIKEGSTYINDACGKSESTLRIDIGAGVGNINLEVGI